MGQVDNVIQRTELYLSSTGKHLPYPTDNQLFQSIYSQSIHPKRRIIPIQSQEGTGISKPITIRKFNLQSCSSCATD
ncbi:MAG: hypothetical protein SVY53_00915 [Chloroflexota bacterium]|nr:hypothetical protein [Chloroflexota bacterium]